MLDHADAKPLLFMFTVSAPSHSSADKAGPRGGAGGKALMRASGSQAGAGAMPSPAGASALAGLASASSSLQALDVCRLEGCGLGWRVRPPLVRRSPWTVAAQRMRLCIEALGGAKIEKVYTLLDHHELAPCISYEISIGDLHTGDACHVPVLVWLPALASELPMMDVVRFSLQYVDAVKIDTKSCELCAGVARPAVRPLPPPATALPHEHAYDQEALKAICALPHPPISPADWHGRNGG